MDYAHILYPQEALRILRQLLPMCTYGARDSDFTEGSSISPPLTKCVRCQGDLYICKREKCTVLTNIGPVDGMHHIKRCAVKTCRLYYGVNYFSDSAPGERLNTASETSDIQTVMMLTTTFGIIVVYLKLYYERYFRGKLSASAESPDVLGFARRPSSPSEKSYAKLLLQGFAYWLRLGIPCTTLEGVTRRAREIPPRYW